jgi:flavin reductase (DIM6/NTAB) family NADH-FMN oxidoreductase RutF
MSDTKRRSFDPSTIPFPETHRILLSGVAPRPIAFVGSQDREGRVNLSPFSFFNAFGVNPPVVCFSPAFAGKTGLPKDTLLNVLETKECTISIISHDMVHQASLASAPYARGVDEFEKGGFTKLRSERIAPPGVAESPFVMETKLLHHIDFGGKPGSANMLICEVLMMHVRDDVFLESGSISPALVDPVARMGGPWYARAKDGAFQYAQPTTPMLGIDGLPEGLRRSSVLNGAELSRLAAISQMPKVTADLNSKESHERLKQLLASATSVEEVWEAMK